MWPIVWQTEGFRLGTYGVIVGIAILVCLWLARQLGKRDNLPERAVNDIGLGVFVSGFAGSWLLGIGVNWLSGVPMDWSELRNAGAIHGGLIGGCLGLLVLTRAFKIPLRSLLDAYMPTIALGQAIGRLGCFAAGCCFGTESHLPWAVVFESPIAHELGGVPLHVPLHPVQLYDALAHLLLFGVLLWLHRHHKMVGSLFGLWCILEGMTRSLVEVFRGDLGRGVWFGLEWLSTGRLTAALFIVVGAGVVLATSRRHAS